MSREQAMAILERKLDPETLAIVRAAIEDSDRLNVIRDAFLQGRDAEAVQLIRELDPYGVRKAIGINSGAIVRVAETVQIAIRPQLPFRGSHLIISPSCAAYFMISELRVGNQSQFVMSSDIAADLFAADNVLRGEVDSEGFYTVKIDRKLEALLPLRIDMPVCEVGQQITLIVTCTRDADGLRAGCEFRGALLGRVESHG